MILAYLVKSASQLVLFRCVTYSSAVIMMSLFAGAQYWLMLVLSGSAISGASIIQLPMKLFTGINTAYMQQWSNYSGRKKSYPADAQQTWYILFQTRNGQMSNEWNGRQTAWLLAFWCHSNPSRKRWTSTICSIGTQSLTLSPKY